MLKAKLFLLLLFFLTACSLVPSPEDAYNLATLTPLPTEPGPGTPTAVPDGAEGVAITFFRAWENGDYLGMYSLLSPGSQALIDSQAFINRYTEAVTTAGVVTIKTQPLAVYQEGDRAEFQVRVTWQTAVVGEVVRDHGVEMVYSQSRWGVSWHEGLILPELAGGNRLAMQYRNPARANVYDAQGTALAFQGSAFTLGVVPGRITDEAGLLNVLSPLFGKTTEEIKEMYAAAAPDWLWPVGDISTETYQTVYTSLEPYLQSGALQANQRLTRLYPEGGIAPHIVGYMGRISPEQLSIYQAEGFQGDEIVGLSGVEGWGEDYLNGERGGTLTVVGPSGETITTLAEYEPRQARSVYTTLDATFQQAVQQALSDALTSHPLGTSGAVVVLDVNSGKVLAMGSYPSYDPAIFDPSIPTLTWAPFSMIPANLCSTAPPRSTSRLAPSSKLSPFLPALPAGCTLQRPLIHQPEPGTVWAMPTLNEIGVPGGTAQCRYAKRWLFLVIPVSMMWVTTLTGWINGSCPTQPTPLGSASPPRLSALVRYQGSLGTRSGNLTRMAKVGLQVTR
ncbi:MAG: hypothetical protein IPL78_07815 [Chloroflexi bacterium]|nr:hypothetical protein [Chloroflexota bacterium]